jgi:hypothetical protein
MSIRKRRSDRSGRAPLASPGRPPVAGRLERSQFWLAIAAGMSSEDAAVAAGVSMPVGFRWFGQAGGMPPGMFRSSAKPLSRRYLSLEEREEISLLLVQGHSMREIGRRLGRSASTISRELRRNAATRSGGLAYRATTAQWHADRSARRPKPSKLVLNATLRSYVEERLAGAIADRLPGRYDDAHQPRSHLPGIVHSRPRCAAPGACGMLANRAGVADAEGARTPARQGVRLAGDHDQPASCRSGRSRGA